MSNGANPTSVETSRRTFLAGVAMFCVASVAALVGLVRFLIPNVEYGRPKQFKVGMPNTFPDKTATYLPDYKVFVVRNGDTFIALSAVCPHLGCTVRADQGGAGFTCPCHGSKFTADGTNAAGPAPKALEAYEMRSDDSGALIVDKSHVVSPKSVYRI